MAISLVEQVSESISMFEIPGCTFTPVSLTIERGMDFDQWAGLMEALKKAERGVQFWIGDGLCYGEMEYGEKYAQVLEMHDKTGIPIDTLRNYQWVADNVKPVTRVTKLDWSVHREIASLPEPEQQKILKRGIEQKEQTGKYTKREAEKDAHKVKRKLGKVKTEIQVLQDPQVRAFLTTYSDSVQDWEKDVPQGASFLHNMFQAHIGQIQWQLDRSVENDCATIMLVFDDWDRATDSDIFNWLQARGYFMRDPELDERLEYMACIGDAEKREDNCPRDCTKHAQMLLTVSIEESRQEGRRGNMGSELYQVHPAYKAKFEH